jgi:hypothetical protein
VTSRRIPEECSPQKQRHINLMTRILHDIIYLSTVIRLTPGRSSTVHIYTQTIYRTTQMRTIHRTTQITTEERK